MSSDHTRELDSNTELSTSWTHPAQQLSGSFSTQTKVSSIGQSGDGNSDTGVLASIPSDMTSSHTVGDSTASKENAVRKTSMAEQGARNIFKKRKPIFIYDEEVKETLKKLTPLYRRRIFIQQLRDNWYWVASFIGVVVALSITTAFYLLPTTKEFVSSPSSPAPLYASWGIISINGRNAYDILAAVEKNDSATIDMVTEKIKTIYTSARVNVVRVELTGFNSSINNLNLRSRAMNPTNKQSILFHHTAHLSTTSDLGVTESEMQSLIRLLRKTLLSAGTIVFDPNLLSVRHESTAARAASITSFLDQEFPSFDLALISQRSALPSADLICKALPSVERGRVVPDDCYTQRKIRSGLSCMTECVSGAVLTGSRVRICLSSGVWSGWPAFCENPCPKLQPPSNGGLSPRFCIKHDIVDSKTDLLGGQACYFYCNPGYMLFGSLRIVCKSDGQWSATPPICKETCSGLSPPDNGHVVPKYCFDPWVLEESFCTFYCDAGYTIYGEVTISCLGNGKWTNSAPFCSKTCPKLKAVEHAQIHPTLCWKESVQSGTSCVVECHSGYHLSGSYQRTCNSEGIWTGEVQTCLKRCPKLSHRKNLITGRDCILYDSISGTKCFFSCEAGYEIKGVSEVLCLRDGSWDDRVPECVPACGQILEPDIGNVICTGTILGSECTLYCPETYQLTGSRSVTCNTMGLWSKPIGYCVSMCGKLTIPSFSTVHPAECELQGSQSGQICHLECYDGYDLIGEAETTCNDGGEWSNNSTICIKQDQYLIGLHTSAKKLCLNIDPAKSIVYKEDWSKCLLPKKFSKWTLLSNKVFRNGGGKLCLAAQSAETMSLLEVKQCDLIDPLQLWEWHSTPDNSHIIKLQDYDLYIWEGYLSYSRIMLINDDTAVQALWSLYDVAREETFSLYGVIHNGQCESLITGPNGRWTPSFCSTSRSRNNSFCSYVCEDGFSYIGGVSEIHCVNGIWNDTLDLKCAPDCVGFNPSTVAPVKVSPSACTSQYVPEETVCDLNCPADNTYQSGEKYVICLRGGVWSSSLPTCVDVCPKLSIENGEILQSENCTDSNGVHRTWSRCEIVCHDGYDPAATTYNCLDSGWDKDIVPCSRHCRPPWTALSHGSTDCVGKTVYFTGDECSVSCDNRYELIGDASIICLENGSWSGNLPRCEMECSNCELDDEDGTRFHIWNSMEGSKFCLSVLFYDVLHVHEVIVKDWADCSSSNAADLWTMNTEGLIIHVGSSKCLSYDQRNASHMFVHLTFCDDTNVAKWMCIVQFGYYQITTNGFYLRHNDILSSVVLTLERHFIRGLYERASYEWKANNVSGTEGSICGISSDMCPQLLLTEDMSFIPSNETTCSNPVPVDEYCHIQCNFGSRRGLSDPGLIHTCMSYGLWDTVSINKCAYTSCNPLVMLPNSNVSPSSCSSIVSVGTVCDMDCDVGYFRVSQDNISDPAVCLPNGKWSEVPPQCLFMCSALLSPINGSVSANCRNGTLLLEGDSCSFSCDFDHGLVGNEMLVCESGGWNGLPPTCSSIARNLSAECPTLSSRSNGLISPTDSTTNSSLPYGLLASLECAQGYLPEKDSLTTIKCQGNGEWTGILGNCVQACPEFQFQNDSMNSRFGIDLDVFPSRCSYNNTNYVGDICKPTCLNSTHIMKATIDQLFGPYHSTCGSGAEWGNVGPDHAYDCLARYRRKIRSSNGKCLSLKPHNVLLFDDCSKNGDDMMWFDSLDTFISRVDMSLCLSFKSDEFFSEASMELCNSSDPRQRWICTNNELVNHHYNRKLTHFESSDRLFVTYYRNYDYSLNFPSLFQVADGYDYALSTSVNESEMLCRRRSLGYFCEYKQWDNFDDVHTNCSKATDGLSITLNCDFTCHDNMTNIGVPEISCSNVQTYQSSMVNEFPTWIPQSTPSCSLICPDLTMPSYATSGMLDCSSNTLSVGTSCRYDDFSCTIGYLEVGSRTRTCMSGGHWDGADLACYAMCPKLDIIGEGSVAPADCVTNVSLPGTKCNIACDTGQEIDGNSSIICQMDGQWSSPPAICRSSCSALRSLQNGQISPTDCDSSQTNAGVFCVYQCDSGYVLNAPTATKQCQPNGLWDDPTVWLCSRFCPPLAAPTNGQLVNESGYNYAVGSVVRTTCDSNYVADRNVFRKCLDTRQWSGEAAECVLEEHFMLVQDSPPSTPICLLSDEAYMIQIELLSDCVRTSRYLWMWKGMKLRNIAANKCLQAATNDSVSFLTLDDCNDSDNDQDWACTPFRNRKILTLAISDLIPAFNDSISSTKVGLYKASVIDFLISKSFASFSYLQWYNASSNDIKTPICQGRALAQHCRKISVGRSLIVTPTSCLLDTVPLNTICEFSCPDGYVINGDSAPAKCDQYGYWNKGVPKCLPACSGVSVSDNVIVNPQYCTTRLLFHEGEICRFNCPPGFHLQGETSSVCIKNGNWSSKPPVCVRKCAPLQIPFHGAMHPMQCSNTPILENTTCGFSCLKTDYIIKGSEYRTCTANGTWTGMKSLCVKPCHWLSTPVNTIVYPQSCTNQKSPPGSSCEILCNPDFVPRDPQYKICHENGSWIGDFQECQRFCPGLQNFSANDVIFPLACTYSPLAPWSVCGVKCKNGFSVMGERSIHCLSSGSWSGSLGTCKRKCPVLQRPLHGTIYPVSCCGQEKFAGTVCTLTCQDIFVANGPTVSICGEDGEWSVTEMKCRPGCPPIVQVEAATIHPDSCRYSTKSHQSFCDIQCDEGYVTPFWTRNLSVTCMPNGFWDRPIPSKCMKKCRIPTVANAQVSCLGEIQNNEVLEQVQCVIKCQPYYTHTSQPLSTCSDGEWSPPTSTCIYNPYPLLIIHRANLVVKCLGLDGNVIVMKSWSDCKLDDTGTRWTWRSKSNIVNSKTGYCMTAFSADEDSPLVTSPCNALDPLQHWDCDEKEPYRLYLNGTDLGPSLLYGDSNFVTLQKSVDIDALFYTFNPNSENELGTLCSMRFQGGCHGLTLRSGVHVVPAHCSDPIVLPGTICRFSCLVNGQFIVGPDASECQDSGLWHPDSKTLCDFRCPPLALPASTILYDKEDCLLSYANYNDVCNYVCREGYTLVSDYKARTCFKDGMWSDKGNVACSKTCSELKNPLNGMISPQPCITGTCTLFCDVNFRAEGPRVRTCKETGFWTEHEFMCVPDVQFAISSKIFPLKLRMCLTVVDETRIVKAHCKAGYKSQMWRWKSHFALENVGSEHCLAMREDIYVDRLPGYLSVARTGLQGDDALVHLNESEKESDVYVTTCNVTDPRQSWECETYDAKQPFRFILKDMSLYLDSGPQFTGRVILLKNFTYGSQWAVADYEGITTICSRRNSGICPPINQLYGGTIQPLACYSNFITAGTTCYFQCKGNFVIEGSFSTVCKKDGFWTNSPPSCLGINKCPSIEIMSPLTVTPSICNGRKVREGRTCIFKCPDTHRLVGYDRIFCDSNSTWSGPVPICKFYCPSLSPPHGGSIYPESCQNLENNVGKTCNFNCSDGYDIVGSATLVCKSVGWSETKPVCRKLCPMLFESHNSTILPRSCVTKKSYSGSMCTVKCDSGYRIVGNSSTSCHIGSWSNDLGICAIGLCLEITNQDGVKSISYKDLKNDAIVTGTVLEFECEDEYLEQGSGQRICGSDGVWIGGTQLCVLITCKPLPQIYRGKVSPDSCQTGDNLIPGSSCSFTCDDGNILSGPPTIQCMRYGQWSTTDFPVCYDSNVVLGDRHMWIAAMTADEWSTLQHATSSTVQNNPHCLVASNNDTTPPMLSECLPASALKLWRWYGSARLQNLETQLCLDLNEVADLTMKTCDLDSQSQELECGNMASEISFFQVNIGGMSLSHGLRAVTNVTASGMWWVGVEVEDIGGRESNMLELLRDHGSTLCSFMCGGTFTADSGDFASPNFPNAYPPNVICKWAVNVEGMLLFLNLAPVKLSLKYDEDKLHSATDKLVVSLGDNGDEMNVDVLQNLYSVKEYSQIKTQRGVLHLEFHSDHTFEDNQKGLAVRWFSKKIQPVLEYCGMNVSKRSHGYPWQVAIISWRLLCDGVLVRKRFVLTLAHCVSHVEIGNLANEVTVAYRIASRNSFVNKLRRGLWDKADRIWVNENYDQETSWNNMAIIRLSHGIHVSNEYSNPICLPTIEFGRIDRAGDTCIVTGFHKDLIDHVSQSTGFNTILNAVILSEKRCEILMRYERGLPYDKTSFTCAKIVSRDDFSHRNSTSLNIENDGGSVLQCLWNDNWYVVGIKNFALTNINDGTYYVFTNVFNGYSWIAKTLEYGFYRPSLTLQ